MGEAWFFGGADAVDGWLNREPIAAWRRRSTVENSWMHNLDDEGVLRFMQRAMIEGVLRRPMNRKPAAKACGDKTPLGYVLEPEKLHRLFPEAVFIEMVRDGRDVAVSHAFMALRQGETILHDTPERGAAAVGGYVRGEAGDGGVPLMDDVGVRMYAEIWKRAVRGGERARALWGERFVRVKYEELLAEPGRARAVLAALGVDDSEATVAACVAASRFEAVSGGRSAGTADAGSFYRKGVAGDWRGYLSAAQVQIYEGICGEELRLHGYA